MSAFDKLKNKAKGLLDTKGDKIAEGVDKATDVIDDKTGGKFSDKLEKVDEMAQKLDKTPDDAADDGAAGAAEE